LKDPLKNWKLRKTQTKYVLGENESHLCAFVQDVIHNADMKLDWEFKLSLITDLVMVFAPFCSLHCLLT